MLRQLEPGIHDQRWHHDEHRVENDVQHEDAGVQPQQLDVEKPPAAFFVRFFPPHGGRVWNLELYDPDRRKRQQSGEREDAIHADGAVQQRRADQREREHRSDRGADHRHDLGPVLLARQVSGERHGHRIDRTGPLQGPRRDGGPDVVRRNAQETARGKDDQTGIQGRLSPPSIRCQAEGNLQNSLRQAIRSERDADQRKIAAALELRRVHGEHRENEEQAEHAQAVDAGEARAGAQFCAAHAFGEHGEVSAGMRNAL